MGKNSARRAAAGAATAATDFLAPEIMKLIPRLRKFSTCDVGDVLVRTGLRHGNFLYGMGRTPAPTSPWKICGPAVTVRMSTSGGAPASSQDLLPFVEYNEPGKVMVIETPETGKSTQVSACWGAIESARAKALGAEGVIVSGNMRQPSHCHEIGLPVLSRGIAALGPRNFLRHAKVNEMITIRGINIRRNDILLADENGVVVVGPAQLDVVVAECELAVEHDEVVLKAIESGETMKTATKMGTAQFPRREMRELSPR